MAKSFWILLLAFLFGTLSAIAQPRIEVAQTAGSVVLSWDDAAGIFVLESSSVLGNAAQWSVFNGVPLVQNGRRSLELDASAQTRFFRLSSGNEVLTTVSDVSPAFGEEGVAVTRETILSFSAPLAPGTVLGGSHLFAEFGGRRVLGRVELSTARDKVTLFYQENLPASAEVKVFFEGDGLKDSSGKFIDPDGDGVPGGVFATYFTTLGNTALDNTGVIGHVFAAETAGGTNVPLRGVTVTVDGAEETLRAVTDAQGAFRLQPAPVGRFFVHIDGRTVTNLAAGIRYPDQAYYPFVGKAWDAVAGFSNNLAGGNGIIYLPLIQADALKAVSSAADTKISFSPSVVATNPAYAEVSITVPANSLFADNGTRGGKVGIAPVPPDRLPSPLPPGLELPVVITVQTDGPLNFDQPAPICFPNLPDPVLGVPLPPGTKQALISFNHDKGEWEAVGTMTVSADGKLICTDPGSGIRQPGWHGSGPQPGGPPPPPPPNPLPPPPPPPVPPPDPPPPNPCEDGSDPECYCQAPAPNPAELQKCYNDVEQQFEAPCRKAAQITYNERVRICLRGFKDGNKTFAEYQSCLKAAKDQLAIDRKLCNQQANDYRSSCNKCYGPPKPPDPEPLPGGRLNAAAVDPIAALTAKQDELAALVDRQPPLAQAEFVSRVDALISEIDALAGGDVRGLLLASAAADQRSGQPSPRFVLGNAPPYSIKYAARIVRPAGDLIVRGNTLPFAQYSIFVPRDGFLVGISFYDPVSKRYAFLEPDRRPESNYAFPRLFMPPNQPENMTDTDGDGLSDSVEFVYGTNDANPDSDGDGIKDGVEAADGTDPLGGLSAQTGIIGSVKTAGNAVDVCAFGDYAALAEGAAGVSIFNVANPSIPVRLVQVDTPGTANAVAFNGTYLAVSDDDKGLAIIDLASPANAFVRSQVPLPARASSVHASGGYAYVGLLNGSVCRVDLATGTLLQTVAVGSGRIDDLLVDGDSLYVYSRLDITGLSLAAGQMTLTGRKLTVQGVSGAGGIRFRLSGGGDRLYATHARGFAVIEWPDASAAPVLLANNSTAQVGWKQIVPNSGGIGVAAVGLNSTSDGPHDIYLHDLRPNGTNSVFLSSIVTPGYAAAVALQGRLAFVADGAAGLQVINYLPADIAGVAPSISLQTDFLLNPARAESGKRSRLTAIATDDVLVSAVEFYIDGVMVRRDESYPFTHEFFIPPVSQTSFTLRARAIDTAGNVTFTDPLVVQILPDATPPEILGILPADATVLDSANRVSVRFSEAMDPASFTTQNLRIVSTGADGFLGTPDDSVLSVVPQYIAATASAQFDFPAGLPNGLYVVQVGKVRDVSGIELAAAGSATFLVAAGGPDGDPDDDGLPNIEEMSGGSNPFNPDTDGDGWVDEVEVHGKTNPRDPSSYPETRVISRPPLDVLVIDPAEVLPAFPGPIVARPPVEVIAISPLETESSGPWLARPPIDVMLGSIAEEAAPGPWVARPPVEMNLLDIAEEKPSGPYVARPPATVKRNP